MDEMAVCSAQLEALAQHLGRAQQALHAWLLLALVATVNLL
jgi:hypothetical protein